MVKINKKLISFQGNKHDTYLAYTEIYNANFQRVTAINRKKVTNLKVIFSAD